jgi:hypothetical protein
LLPFRVLDFHWAMLDLLQEELMDILSMLILDFKLWVRYNRIKVRYAPPLVITVTIGKKIEEPVHLRPTPRVYTDYALKANTHGRTI